ncbi:MAG: DUF368 domain-containing protein [Mycoplasmatales bacterium]|nr:DUF368 domain-containing protein [Mycoplasmatales bacterium]
MKINMEKNDDYEDIKETVSIFSKTKGWKKVFELFKWIFTGLFMGTSDAIPGYSGGTTLALIGFYKRLVIISKCVFVPIEGIKRRQALFFMIPFGMGWLLGIFSIAKLTEYITSNGMGLELIFFFSFFVIFAIPIYLRSIKKDEASRIKRKRPVPKYKKVILLIVAFSIVITIATIVLVVRGGAPFHGTNSKSEKFDLSQWWLLAIVAFIAGMVTLIPGGSGAIIQLLSGLYDKIHWVIMAHPTQNALALFIFATFSFLGMLSMIFIVSWFFSRKEVELEFFSLGMLLASPIAILLVPETSLWGHISEWRHILGIIFGATLGASLGTTINIITKRSDAKNLRQ